MILEPPLAQQRRKLSLHRQRKLNQPWLQVKPSSAAEQARPERPLNAVMFLTMLRNNQIITEVMSVDATNAPIKSLAITAHVMKNSLTYMIESMTFLTVKLRSSREAKRKAQG